MSESSSVTIPQIQKLQGAANFHAWRGIAKTFLMVMDVWEIVNGETRKPALEKATDRAKWMRKAVRAQAFLLSNIDESLTPLIALAEDAHQSWTILEDKFDRKTVTNLHSLLKSIFNLKCTNKREVAAHITRFDEMWQRFTVRTRTSGSTEPDSKDESLETLLKPLAESDRAKGAFFLTSLPTSLDYVVENITTKPSVTYTDICNKLLDMFPAGSNTATASNSAFATTDGTTDRGKRKGKGSDKVCTYCKSKGRRGLGHLISECYTKQRDDGKHVAAAAMDSKPAETLREDSNYAFTAGWPKTPISDRWIFDSAATSHMTPNRAGVENARPTDRVVTVGGGHELRATHIGSAKLTTLLSDGTTETLTLNDTLVVPELQFPLLSWPRMAEAGANKTGDKSGTIVYHKGVKILETVSGLLGRLQVVRVPEPEVAAVSVMQLHRKLAHLPPSAFPTLHTCNGLPPIPLVSGPFDCPSCSKAKFTRTIPKKRESKATHPFEAIHSDVCGPFSTQTPGGSRYFISAVDEFSHYVLGLSKAKVG